MGGRPLVTIAGAFAAGVALAASCPTNTALTLSGACLLSVTLAYVATRGPRWRTAVLLLAVVVSGILRYVAANQVAPEDVSRLAPRSLAVVGTVASDVSESFVAGNNGESETSGPGRFLLDVEGILPPEHGALVAGSLRSASGRLAVTSPPQSLRYGDRVLLRGQLDLPSGPRNPGESDRRGFLAHRGIYATLHVAHPSGVQLLTKPAALANPWYALVNGARRQVWRATARLPFPHSAVLEGVLLGEHGSLPPGLQTDVARTGTGHILATAGLHVGVLTGLLLALFRLWRLPRRAAHLATLVSLAAYAGIAGGRPAVVRAVVIAGLFLLGVVLEREPDGPSALALAMLLLLLANPLFLVEPGFQYTFAVVISLALLLPYATPLLHRLRSRIPARAPFAALQRFGLELVAGSFVLALAAQIGVTPLLAYYEHSFAPISILANTLVVPVVALVLAFGFAFVAVLKTVPFLAPSLGLLLKLPLAYLLAVIPFCATLPGIWNVQSPPFALVIGYYALVWYAAWKWRPPLPFDSEPDTDEAGAFGLATLFSAATGPSSPAKAAQTP